MEHNYTAQAEALTTEELQAVVKQYKEYEPAAVLVAIAELERREAHVPNLEELKQELLQEQEPPQPETLGQKAQNFLMLFVPQRQYFVTPVLLNLNLLVFIAGAVLGLHVLNPDAEKLVGWGANFGPYTLTGEWWRLLTSMFLHGGLIHLLLNMVALVNIGVQLEMLVGRVQFILAYLLCGLAGSVASLWWTSPEVSVSVGASGAIFGMFGMLLMVFLLEREMEWKSKRAILGNMLFVIGINLAYGMRGNIDNAAHIGGLVAGMVYGAILLLRSDRYITQKYGAVGNAGLAGGGLLLLVVCFNMIPFTGKARYVYTLEQVGKKEQTAMEAMLAMDKAGGNVEADKMLPVLEQGIQLWEESEELLEEIDDAPAGEEARLSALLDYVRLRKMSYQMLRDDLQAGRPPLHQKQQQMLSAINHYAMQLQRGDFSGNTVQSSDQPAGGLVKGSNGEELSAEDMAAIGDPLYVLDGVELGVASKSDPLPEVRQLSPETIESITVLQRAEAVKLYGEKASGGAILITTKK